MPALRQYLSTTLQESTSSESLPSLISSVMGEEQTVQNLGYLTPSSLTSLSLVETPANLVSLGTSITPILNQVTQQSLGSSLPTAVSGWISSPTYTPMFSNLNSYLWQGVNHIIPTSDLFGRLKSYESKYGMPSEEFYSKWIHGKIEDSPETNDWINLYVMFQNT